MKLVMATGNEGKVRELVRLLDDPRFEILSSREVGCPMAVEEDGETFLENAQKKALYAYRYTHLPSLADDSGLCVDALSGAPGVYSARWAGEGAPQEALLSKLLHCMEGKENRHARFVSALCLVFSEDDILKVTGTCEGEILSHPRGQDGFGYDPLFYIPSVGKTFAEMTTEEKNASSHRARAVEALRALLSLRALRANTL